MRSILRPLLSLIFALTWSGRLSAQNFPALDPAFHPVISCTGGFVSAMAVQSDGKIVVAGGFSALQGTARLGLARLNQDGTLDSTFDPGLSACCGGGGGFRADLVSPITALAVQADGKVLIGGSFTTVRGLARHGLARLHADGSLDAGFDPGTSVANSLGRGGSLIAFLLAQPDGRVVVGGSFNSVQGVPRNGIARLNANGTLDASFDPGAGIQIEIGEQLSLGQLLSDGRILVAGRFELFQENNRFSMARLHANGSLDTSFDPPIYLVERERGPQSINGFAMQPDGKIVVSGTFDLLDSNSAWDLGRLNANGTADPSFTASLRVPDGESFVVLGSQLDGKILGLYSASHRQPNQPRTLFRLNADGSPDASFTPVPLESDENRGLRIAQAVRQADGKWLVGGHLANPDRSMPGLLRVDTGGKVDGNFRAGFELAEAGAVQIQAVEVQSDGKILVGGTFNLVNGTAQERFARLLPDGRLDSSMATVIGMGETGDAVSAITLDQEGRILLGGQFRTVNGVVRNGLARLNSDGTLDTTFQTGTGTNEKGLTGFDAVGRVVTIAVDTNQFVWIAGDFVMYAGVRIPYIARLKPEGALDTTFNMGFRLCDTCDVPTIRSLAPLEDGTMLVAGSIERIGVTMSPNLVRVLRDGNVAGGFLHQLGAGDEVWSLAPDANAGAVAAVSGNGKGRLVRFRPDGTPEEEFKPEILSPSQETSAPGSAVVVDREGRVIVAGALGAVGAEPRLGLARLKKDGSLDTEFKMASGFRGGIFEPASTRSAVISDAGLQPDGGLIVSGHFATAAGSVRLGLARFLTDSRPFERKSGGGASGSRPQLLSPGRLPDGTFTFLVAGEPGKSYRVEVSGDLVGWGSLGVVAGAAQPVLFRDPLGASAAMRYYRAVVLP